MVHGTRKQTLCVAVSPISHPNLLQKADLRPRSHRHPNWNVSHRNILPVEVVLPRDDMPIPNTQVNPVMRACNWVLGTSSDENGFRFMETAHPLVTCFDAGEA